MRQEQLQLTGGGDQSKRRELDFYPTPANVTHALMIWLSNNLINPFERLNIHEPACGNGAMADVISSYGHTVYMSDIKTEIGDILDFVNDKYPLGFKNRFDAIITNPPFNLSEDFIRLSLKRSRIVCMLLKSQYWHAKSRAGLFNETKPFAVLPLTWRPDFLEHERLEGDKKGAPTMEVCWTIWAKDFSNSNRTTLYQPLLKPNTSC